MIREIAIALVTINILGFISTARFRQHNQELYMSNWEPVKYIAFICIISYT